MRLRRIVRSPFVFWLVAVVLAVLTGMVVSRIAAQARLLSARYGPLVPVVVAARSVELGTELAAADLTVSQVPASFRPDTALADEGQALAKVVLVPLEKGQVVMAAHLAPEGLRGIAALLPPGARAVAVPGGGVSVPLRRGDLVDVIATFDPDLTGGGDPTFAVAAGALVLDVGAEATTLAVAPEEAKAIAFSVANGSLTLALASPVPVRAAARPPQRAPLAATPSTTRPASTR